MFQGLCSKGTYASAPATTYATTACFDNICLLTSSDQTHPTNLTAACSARSPSSEGKPSLLMVDLQRKDCTLIGRSDVLRSHLFRCEQRGLLAVPEKLDKGRKRTSCDSCVKLRTKCDSQTPCGRCQELGKDCIRGMSCPWRRMQLS